jgi:hypothetical protein
MKTKNVEGLFVEVMENLLVEGPDNPIKFIIDYMFEHFPDQGRYLCICVYIFTGSTRARFATQHIKKLVCA